jgi:hypothetical protein
MADPHEYIAVPALITLAEAWFAAIQHWSPVGMGRQCKDTYRMPSASADRSDVLCSVRTGEKRVERDQDDAFLRTSDEKQISLEGFVYSCRENGARSGP